MRNPRRPVGEPIEVRLVEGPLRTAPAPSRLTWHRLARWGGLAQCGLLTLGAMALGDIEALVVAVALATAVWLAAGTRRRLGLAGLGAISAVVLFFMLTAALSNLANGERVSVIVLPAWLVVGAMVTIVAGLAALLRDQANQGITDLGPRRVGRVGLGLAVSAALVALATPSHTEQVDPGDLVLASSGLAFSEDALMARSGTLTVHMRNEDLFWHTFTLDELAVDLRVPIGGMRSVRFEAPPGSYRFYCRIPGHAEAGMVGTLEVRG